MTGLLGGTFDPVHLGHLDVARVALRMLSLDRVLFIPAHEPPHRAFPNASGADRLAMVKLAIRDEPKFEASTIELDNDGPSYTAVTIDRFLASGKTSAASSQARWYSCPPPGSSPESSSPPSDWHHDSPPPVGPRS